MDLYNKKIVFVIYYKSEVAGNIIVLFDRFAEYLIKQYDAKIFWVFPKQDSKPWLDALVCKYTVAFTSDPFGIIPEKKHIDELCSLFAQWQPDIVHSNFEQYDISLAKVIKKLGGTSKLVIHLHDIMSFSVKGRSNFVVRYLRRRVWYWLRYNYWGKSANYISVSPEMAFFVNHIRTHTFSEPPKFLNDRQPDFYNNISIVINGIVPERLPKVVANRTKDSEFTFLTFGTNYRGKGIDTLLKASDELRKKRTDFRIVITKGNGLFDSVNEYYNGEIPGWIDLIQQTEDVASLFSSADCYISASRGETMSMAIAEATFYDLPVIQSDIPGTYWNANNPSTFLFKLEDYSDLLSKMEKVMDYDKIDLERLCKQTEETNRSKLSVGQWISAVEDVYKKL